MTLPVVMTASGPTPNSPATLNSDLIATVQAEDANFTANLPGLLIEDLTSTGTAMLSQMDQARVDAINSVTPYGANAFILAQQGTLLGLPQGTPTNTSVYVVFTGPAGYVLPAGFVVGDNTYQYVLQDGGVIQANGTTAQLYAVANQSGSWSVTAGSVTQIVTSLPAPYNTEITVTNPQAGVASTGSESVQSYRSRIVAANQVAGQGTPNYIQTLLQAVPGVTPRLVAILQTTFGWEVICGGGDPYAVAFAIYRGVLDLSTIVGSITPSRNISVTLTDSPNQYTITSVNPPQQVVTVDAIWNTNLPNFTASAQVNQLASTAIQNYINSIIVGQPINVFAMESAFQQAVVSALPTNNLTRLVFSVAINGSVVDPESGTGIIPSDLESYFQISASGVAVSQG
jgi:Baseplate J-like protein